MMLTWEWSEKCGEWTESMQIDGEEKEYTYSLYTGNAYLIVLYEFEEDGKNYHCLHTFWTDETHMKRCLGIDSKYKSENIHTELKKIRLSKTKCRYINKIVPALVKAFDSIDIEIYKD